LIVAIQLAAGSDIKLILACILFIRAELAISTPRRKICAFPVSKRELVSATAFVSASAICGTV
jgi:hypothetical protein